MNKEGQEFKNSIDSLNQAIVGLTNLMAQQAVSPPQGNLGDKGYTPMPSSIVTTPDEDWMMVQFQTPATFLPANGTLILTQLISQESSFDLIYLTGHVALQVCSR